MIVKYPNIFPEDPALKIEFPPHILDQHPNVELHIDVRKFEREPNKKYYCLDFELPNGFVFGDTRDDYIRYYEKSYDKIITICPFTVKKRNEFIGRELYEYTYYPSSSNWDYESKEKTNDLIYAGSGTDWFLNDDILNYKRIIINKENRKYSTHSNVSFDEKMKLISQSKISLTHNIIDCTHITDKSVDNFYNIKSDTLTQHKSRIIESARCKTLILCKKDEFNIIEDWFVPNEDFIYYDDNNFNKIVNEILNNYENYSKIIQSAYNKVKNLYSVNNFVRDFIN
jgi:hypothetical protein